jgi:hypothetical protein
MEHQLMNPISQLFALCVEDLPGCRPPGTKTWATADAADREYAASEYLFREALNACDRAAQRRLAAKFFGAGSAPAAAAPAGRRRVVTAAAAEPAAPKPKIQSNLNMFSVQALLLKTMEKDLKAARSRTSVSPPPTSSAPSTPTSESAKPKKGGRPKKAAAATATAEPKITIEI